MPSRCTASKLSGGFALTRTGERRWILVKTRDAAARPGSDIVAEQPASVRSGRTWQQVARPGRWLADGLSPGRRRTRHVRDPVTIPMRAH